MPDSKLDNQIWTDLEQQVDPAHTALLIIDVQNDFCADDGYIDKLLQRDMSQCQGVVKPISQLVDEARKAGVLVVWVQANYAPENLPAPVLAKQKAMGASMVCCAPGTWGAELYGGLAPEHGEAVIEKHRYSAFSGTPLDNMLRTRGIRTLVLTGVQTNVCIESTLRDGFSKGYYIVVPEDCVGSHTPELHRATLDNVRMLFGTVSTAGQLNDLWAGGLARHKDMNDGGKANAAGK
ncbi:MAG: isochorismatase family cysteine hydrolase [Aquisalimonadaceae bacterium]